MIRPGLLLILFLGAAAAALARGEVAEPAQATAREKYVLFCAGCHGFNGEGGGGAGGMESVAPLNRGMGVFLRDRQGRAYLVNVGGVSSAGMTSAETATVLNYILRDLGKQDLPEDFQPYNAAEIDAMRSKPLDDAVTTRKQIRKRLAARGYSLPAYQWEE